MDLFHVDFQMVRSLEDLTARFTGMGHKSALVLVPDMAQQGALQVEYTRAHCALELGSLGSLTHGVDGVSVSEALQAASGAGVSGGRRARWTVLPILLIVRRRHRPTHQPSV